jgi:hypothetical protein
MVILSKFNLRINEINSIAVKNNHQKTAYLIPLKIKNRITL